VTRLVRATLPLLLAACPARAPLCPDPVNLSAPATPPRPCGGTAVHTDGHALTLRDDGAVLAGERVLLRVEADAITDGHGRRLATRDARSARLVDGDRALSLDDTSVRRDDGLRAQVDPSTGALSVTNPAGESARAPWTLQCARGAWSLGVLALLMHDGLERAQPTATP
jgi:hypothetical protein